VRRIERCFQSKLTLLPALGERGRQFPLLAQQVHVEDVESANHQKRNANDGGGGIE
jgi:hypothetical protein